MTKPEISKTSLDNKLKVVQSNEQSSDLVCNKCGSNNYRVSGACRGNPRYRCLDCKHIFYKGSKLSMKLSYLPIGEDVWDSSKFGLSGPAHRSMSKLSFLYIKQDWLKTEAKRYIRQRSITLTIGTLKQIIGAINRFSGFLELKYPSIFWIQDIDREVMLEYIIYLNSERLKSVSIALYLSSLKQFYETGNLNNWFNVSPYLIRPEDIPKHQKTAPRYIPEEVLKQLNANLDDLPEPIMRMVLVIQETGLRVGELLSLSLNCLQQSGEGGHFIQYSSWKMKKDDTKPISNELVQVIKEQQAYINMHLDGYEYLFCSRKNEGRKANHLTFTPTPRVMQDLRFTTFLKRLAIRHNICDSSGKIWNFQSHQFRHTVGTRMINSGVPQHIIQRFLGHESPRMTSVYAHLHDETLRKEIEKFHETRIINFKGEDVALEEFSLSSNDDLEWFTKKIQARALEHGYCGRPKVMGDCDVPGFEGCYICPYWRTNKNFLPVLEETLERTNNIIEKARLSGWELQVKKNEPIQKNLRHVIETLSEDQSA